MQSKHIQALERKYMGKNFGEVGEGKEDENKSEETKTNESYSTGFRQGDRLREAVYINLGLLALKKCVEALNSSNETAYVPYADSKLTMLLSSGLGGDSKTAVIVCASSDHEHCLETTNALRFGERCSNVETNAKDGTNMLTEMIKKIDLKIVSCEKNIKQKERWEVQEISRKDERVEEGTMESEGFGGVEIKKVTVLVGAEEDRKLLNELLTQRAEVSERSERKL